MVGAGAGLVRGDALRLPFADNTVDLIVTSPPYFALRSYRDGDEHYDGQIGSEESPQAFLEALWAVTAECARVLKPSGSMFVNLGDKYAGSGGHNNAGLGKPQTFHMGTDHKMGSQDAWTRSTRRNAPDRYNQNSGGIPAKSLMLLPERYRIGCVDRLGLIARAVIVWDKPNGLPESVTDRVRRSHEDWVHLTKAPRYFSAVDEIREAHSAASHGWKTDRLSPRHAESTGGNSGLRATLPNPLGKLPGSVWEVATEPLRVPDWVGVDHFAAFPTEWPRRLILGWSPSGVCTRCGEGRRPVARQTDEAYAAERERVRASTKRTPLEANTRGPSGGGRTNAGGYSNISNGVVKPSFTITGEACGCPTPEAPTRPAVVLDPFVGTGTVPMVARSLGRFGVGVDLSADYLRLARWRVWSSGHGSKAVARTWKERQGGLFDAEELSA